MKWSFRPTFKREKQFRYRARAIEKEKCSINLNKSIYIITVKCSFVPNCKGGKIASFGEKTPEVNLIIVREIPKMIKWPPPSSF